MGSHEPLHDLLAQAALGTGWPTLHAMAPDEGVLHRLRAALEGVLGPLPQAEVLVPWAEEPWELRVDLPGLTAERWERVRGLSADVVLRPGLRPGPRVAEDEGVRLRDALEVDGIEAVLYADEEGALAPDLAWPRRADAEVEALEAELAEAVRSVDPALAFRSDRGPDTVAPVVHRSTGRFGVQVSFDAGSAEHRDALLAAVGKVVRARARHPRLRLAPDLLWDVRLDALQLTTWIVGPAADALPGDDLVGPGLTPEDPTGLLVDPSQCEELEIQVLPAGPEVHDAVVHRVLQAFGGEAWPGGPPRWLRTSSGWHFVPTWRALREDVGPQLLDRLRALAGVGGVDGVRLVPGEPAGLGEAWRWADPAWTWAGRRCFLRVRDGLSDRDRLPAADDRRGTPRDVELAAAVQRATPLVRGGRPIVDGAGREGLEIVLDPRTFAEEPLRSALRALGEVDHPSLAPVAHLAHRADHTVVRVWFRSESPEAPTWR